MFIVTHRKIFLGIAVFLVTLSAAAITLIGLRPGMDFTGGALVEVVYVLDRPTQEILKSATDGLGFESILFQPTGDRGVIVRTRDFLDGEHEALIDALREKGELTEERYTSIGPVIGEELKSKAVWAILLVLILILVFIAFAFRKAGKAIPSWKYGAVALITLAHDVIIPTGIFAVLGAL